MHVIMHVIASQWSLASFESWQYVQLISLLSFFESISFVNYTLQLCL